MSFYTKYINVSVCNNLHLLLNKTFKTPYGNIVLKKIDYENLQAILYTTDNSIKLYLTSFLFITRYISKGVFIHNNMPVLEFLQQRD